MKKIASFTVNHTRLLPGIYVSRKDKIGSEVLTTFDLRFTKPNIDQVLDNGGIHTLEHLGATFLRNHQEWQERIIYFGPMGCRTGFYLILWGDLVSEDIIPLLREMADFILTFQGDIPGVSAEECGNYLEHDLSLAKLYIENFKKEVLENPVSERLFYS
ncbi:MAG TPA: S-ribosylhomocysteine lyase [Acholeplasmataceae bacterium]|nr:S-ribosylhomocysteine lyase [Acholeplasmataceae bacterium]